MPLRKPTDENNQPATPVARSFPPEAYQYESQLNVETVKIIQAEADKVLSKDEWAVIDGVDKQ